MSQNQVIPLNQITGYSTGKYCEPDAHGHCPTCSDEALPARVLEINEVLGTAVAQMEDQTVEVDVSLIEDVFPGQVLLVHGGVAIGSQSAEAGT
jgi:hydrogenase maturation factor